MSPTDTDFFKGKGGAGGVILVEMCTHDIYWGLFGWIPYRESLFIWMHLRLYCIKADFLKGGLSAEKEVASLTAVEKKAMHQMQVWGAEGKHGLSIFAEMYIHARCSAHTVSSLRQIR